MGEVAREIKKNGRMRERDHSSLLTHPLMIRRAATRGSKKSGRGA